MSEVRHALTKHGGNLGASGCVAYLFEKKGLISIAAEGTDADALMEAALEAGAEDVVEGDETIDVVTTPADFDAIQEALERPASRSASPRSAWKPSTTVNSTGSEAEQMLKLSDVLEDLDDVQNVYANVDIPDEEVARSPAEPSGSCSERPARTSPDLGRDCAARRSPASMANGPPPVEQHANPRYRPRILATGFGVVERIEPRVVSRRATEPSGRRAALTSRRLASSTAACAKSRGAPAGRGRDRARLRGCESRSALVLGQARGAALAALGAAGLPVDELAAREVKKAVVGTGAASKGQVQAMVAELLRLDASPQTDAADALAAAICQANASRLAGLGVVERSAAAPGARVRKPVRAEADAMIAWVEGVLRDKAPTRIVVDVQGVGYELLVPLSLYAALPDEGKTVALHVHTHVREDAICCSVSRRATSATSSNCCCGPAAWARSSLRRSCPEWRPSVCWCACAKAM